jgi:predicted transcriptional regulator
VTRHRAEEIIADSSSLSHAESTDLARAFLIADAERDELRRQVADLMALGVSLHKAAAAGRDAERAAVVAWLRNVGTSGFIADFDEDIQPLADAIERGAHREEG